MGFHRKSEPATDLILESLYFVALKLDNLVTVLTDDVVMMGMAGVIGIVEFMVFAEIHFANQAALSEQGQSAIDGRARDRFIFLARPGKELVGGEMFFRA